MWHGLQSSAEVILTESGAATKDDNNASIGCQNNNQTAGKCDNNSNYEDDT